VRSAIDKLARLLVQEPEKGRAKSVPATAVLDDGLKVQVTGQHGEQVSTDMSPALGGTGSGPNPGWLLRAAMASCHATVIAMRAAHTGVVLTRLEVTVSSESDVRGMLGTDDGVSAGLSGLRTHVKTHKLSEVTRLQLDLGITRFKCATIPEAEMAANSGAPDVRCGY